MFVIVDNGSDHRGQIAADRLRDAYPNAIMIHTRVCLLVEPADEIVFSVIQKKVLTPATSQAWAPSVMPCWLS